MEEAGVSGGLPGVQMLSEFLFGKAGPGAASNGAAMSLASLSGSTLEAALELPAPGFGMGLQVQRLSTASLLQPVPEAASAVSFCLRCAVPSAAAAAAAVPGILEHKRVRGV